MNFSFQFLDLVVVLLVIGSAVHAAYRGFVAETLAIFGWIAAAYATLFFGQWVAAWMQGAMSPQWLGWATGYVLVFLFVLIPLQFAASRMSQNIKSTQVGTFDSVAGTGFGILRGAAVIGIAYLMFTGWVPYRDQPGWLVNARLFPAIRASADVVASLIPDQKIHGPRDSERSSRESRDPIVEKLTPDPIGDKIEETASEPRASAHRAARNGPVPASRHKPAKHGKKTSGAKDEQGLERLIETTSGDASGKR
jgi:membrane protein required for colicin V production